MSSNPYFDIWFRAGEAAARQIQTRALADLHHAQLESSRRVIDFWFDAWTAPLGASARRSRR